MSPAGPTELSLRGVGRTYGEGPTRVRALADVDLQVHPGELVAVTGPSGSGKSTLLSLAGGLDTPTTGTVTVGELDLGPLGPRDRARLRRRRIGYVFQDFNLLPSLTAAENVSLPLELDGLPQRTARERARESLAEVDLERHADLFPDQLSGGERQRVALARALVGPRGLLLADEPTGALDTRTGDHVMALLRRRVGVGAAGLIVTHDPRHAAWADRTVFLRDGRISVSTGSRLGADTLLSGRGDI